MPISYYKNYVDVQCHSERESTLQVESTFKSIFAFFAYGTLDGDDLKVSFSLFFALRRPRTPSPAMQLNVKKEKSQNNRGKFTGRKCQTV